MVFCGSGLFGGWYFYRKEIRLNIYDEFLAVTDPTGLIQPLEGKSGNGILSTVTASFVMGKLGYKPPGEWKAAILSCQLLPGFYRRHTTDFTNDQESIDDYTAIVSLDREMAKDVLSYGKKHWFYFANEEQFKTKFSFRAWLYRFPSFICHAYQCAGDQASWWQRLCWSISVALPGKLGGNPDDSWIISWVMVSTPLPKTLWSWSQRKAAAYFMKQLHKAGGIHVFLSHYYKGYEHPIPKYAKLVV